MHYFVSYALHSDFIDTVCTYVGETRQFYKIKNVKNNCEYKIRKSNGMLCGGMQVYHEIDEDELVRKIQRQKTLKLIDKTNFKKLTDSQLEKIKRILEEKK